MTPLNPSVWADASATGLDLAQWAYTLPSGKTVAIVRPGETYQSGTGIAVYWYGNAMPDAEELRRRARELGDPWSVPGFPGVGVRLSKPVLGGVAIAALVGKPFAAGEDWSGIVPIIIPADMLSAGLGLAAGGGAIDSAVNAGKSALGGLEDTATIVGGFFRALPWIAVGAIVLIGGVIVYKVVKE